MGHRQQPGARDREGTGLLGSGRLPLVCCSRGRETKGSRRRVRQRMRDTDRGGLALLPAAHRGVKGSGICKDARPSDGAQGGDLRDPRFPAILRGSADRQRSRPGWGGEGEPRELDGETRRRMQKSRRRTEKRERKKKPGKTQLTGSSAAGRTAVVARRREQLEQRREGLRRRHARGPRIGLAGRLPCFGNAGAVLRAVYYYYYCSRAAREIPTQQVRESREPTAAAGTEVERGGRDPAASMTSVYRRRTGEN